MGQFSWLDCKDNSKQILDDVPADTYLLIPKEFGGGSFHETCYEGYGMFGGHDVYEEVALWNRSLISKNHLEQYMADFAAGLSDEEMKAKHGEDYLRHIGIMLAYSDSKNARLKYPIKVTHDPYAVYEDCEPSLIDPDQGWAP